MMRLLLRQHKLCLAYDGSAGYEFPLGFFTSQPNPFVVCAKNQIAEGNMAWRQLARVRFGPVSGKNAASSPMAGRKAQT
jgi:hypothetical protein